MTKGMQIQRDAVACGYWPLFRYNPELLLQGKNPLILDSSDPKIKFKDYAYQENRFKMLVKSNPDEAKRLIKLAQDDVLRRWNAYKNMASTSFEAKNEAQPI
jgi:pyruvate-ferredoxin/flavodoxin oxidoreductase